MPTRRAGEMVLRCTDVRKAYDEVVLFDNFDLEIYRGERSASSARMEWVRARSSRWAMRQLARMPAKCVCSRTWTWATTTGTRRAEYGPSRHRRHRRATDRPTGGEDSLLPGTVPFRATRSTNVSAIFQAASRAGHAREARVEQPAGAHPRRATTIWTSPPARPWKSRSSSMKGPSCWSAMTAISSIAWSTGCWCFRNAASSR